MPLLPHVKITALATLFFSALLRTCPVLAQNRESHGWNEFYRAKKGTAEKIAGSLSPAARLSQLFLVSLPGNSAYRPTEQGGDGAPLIPGGYLFFRRNIPSSAGETAAFTESITRYAAVNGYVPPFLAIDHEGGTVNRLRGILELSSASEIAASCTPSQAEIIYRSQGTVLKKLGFTVNLAPVVEAVTDKNRAFLADRAFGDAAAAAAYGLAAVRGYQDAGVFSVVKHFPASAAADPHSGMSRLDAGEAELDAVYLAPFRAVLAGNDAPAAVLMAHTVTSAGLPPAGISEYWMSEVLRGHIGFTGLVITDDVYMKALEEYGYPPEEAVIAAIDAGADVVMLSTAVFRTALERVSARAASDARFAEKAAAAAVRVLTFKMYCGIL